jgi:3-dehydroquinate dehydratase II
VALSTTSGLEKTTTGMSHGFEPSDAFAQRYRIIDYLSTMKIQIINGPNLNLLGKRETSVYGNASFEEVFSQLKERFANADLKYYQSNVEGEIINKLHETGFSFDGIVLNAGAYTHTSVAIHDAIAAIKSPVAEVHISNVYAREEFRHVSLITSKCVGLITGFGMEGYAMAIQYFLNSKPQ